jgi:hypothetical protein
MFERWIVFKLLDMILCSPSIFHCHTSLGTINFREAGLDFIKFMYGANLLNKSNDSWFGFYNVCSS